MAKPSGTMGETMGFLEEGLPALSRSARAFVRHRPREARLAVTAALEAAAAQCEAEEAGAGPDVPERLRQFIVRRPVGDEIVGVSEAAARLEVSRTTVYEWVRRNTLLAWRSTKRGLHIPAAQILGPGRVVPGLADVVDIVGGPRIGVGVSHPGMAIRGCGRASLEFAQGGPHGRCDRRGARFRRHLLVSAARYPRDRIEPLLLEARFPESYRIMPGRYRATPLGTRPADSRFCSRSAGYSVLYASPDFATAFIETVVRDRFMRRRDRDVALKEITERAWACFSARSEAVLALLDLRGDGLRADRCADGCGSCPKPCGGARACQGDSRGACGCRGAALCLPTDRGGYLCGVRPRRGEARVHRHGQAGGSSGIARGSGTPRNRSDRVGGASDGRGECSLL